MTVTLTTCRADYTGNGVLDTYAYPWQIYLKADIKVYVSGTIKTVDIHYNLVETGGGLGGVDGGNVVFTVGNIPANNAPILVLFDLPLTQLTDYTEGGRFPSQTHEIALDRLVKITHNLQEQLGRTLSFAVTEILSGMEVAAPGAGKYLRWNVGGDGIDAVEAVEDLGNFTQSGTGAVSRTATSKMGERISVMDFGAIGDGVIDDTTAFSTTITAAGANGMIVVPHTTGGYIINGALVLLDRQIFYGMGKPTLKFNTAGIAITTGEYGSIENFVIDNNGGTGDGVRIQPETTIKNLEIDGFSRNIVPPTY